MITGFGEQIKGKNKIKSVLEKHRDFFDKCIDFENNENFTNWEKPAQTVTFLTPKNWD